MVLVEILVVAFVVYFIHAAFWPSQIFGKLAYWLEERLPEKLTLPMFNCPICMAPWWGTAGILIGHHFAGLENIFPSVHWAHIGIVVFGAGGFNAILIQWQRLADTAKEAFDPEEPEPENDDNAAK